MAEKAKLVKLCLVFFCKNVCCPIYVRIKCGGCPFVAVKHALLRHHVDILSSLEIKLLGSAAAGGSAAA